MRHYHLLHGHLSGDFVSEQIDNYKAELFVDFEQAKAKMEQINQSLIDRGNGRFAICTEELMPYDYTIYVPDSFMATMYECNADACLEKLN